MRNPLQSSLADVAALLQSRGIGFALIGGLAVLVHAGPRFTDDVDLVVALDPDEALALLHSLAGTGFSPLFEGADEVITHSFILPVRHDATGTKIDIALGMTPYERQAIVRAQSTDLGSVTVPVVTPEDLLILKTLAGRPRDEDDARRIALGFGNALDWDFVMDIAEQFEVDLAEDLVARLASLRSKFASPTARDGPR